MVIHGTQVISISQCPLNFHKVEVNNFLKTVPCTTMYSLPHIYSVSTYRFVYESIIETTVDYFLKSKSDVSSICDDSINRCSAKG